MDLTGKLKLIDIDISFKDIPIPSKREYKLDLIHRTVESIRRIRWRVFYTNKLQDFDTLDNSNKFNLKSIFKSRKNPPPNRHLEAFEDEIWNLVKNIKFKEYPARKIQHLRKLNKITADLQKTRGILIHADKTGNLYEIDIESYDKLIRKEILKKYKKINENELLATNAEIRKIMDDYNVLDRTEPLSPSTPRITLKDHKVNFIVNPSVRLICPTKSDLGILSKNILDKYIPQIKNSIRLEIWSCTQEAINWFSNITDKNRSYFIQLDISDYYSSINEVVLNRALMFTKNRTNMTMKEINVVLTARKTILRFDGSLWARSDTRNLFDIPMGSSDSAQVTDLVGIFLMYELQQDFPNIRGGLYRDDALFLTRGRSNRNYNTIIKNLHQFFARYGLKVSIEDNKTSVNFLDVNLDLSTGMFSPFHKINANIKYINRGSNHPPSIKNALIKNVSNRLSTLSYNEEVFLKHAPHYNQALNKAGYDQNIEYSRCIKHEDVINCKNTPNPNNKYNNKDKNNNKTKMITCKNSITGNRSTVNVDKSWKHKQGYIGNAENHCPNNNLYKHNNITSSKTNNNNVDNFNNKVISYKNQKVGITSKHNIGLNNGSDKRKDAHFSNDNNRGNEYTIKNNRNINSKIKHNNEYKSREHQKPYNRIACIKDNEYIHNDKKIWIIIPYAIQLKTNLVKSLYRIINKYFGKHSKFHPSINKNKFRVGFSTSRNISQIIAAHNTRKLNKHYSSRSKTINKSARDHNAIPPLNDISTNLLNMINPNSQDCKIPSLNNLRNHRNPNSHYSSTDPNLNRCNCRIKENCVLNGKCMVKGVVYRCKIEYDLNKTAYYVGSTRNLIKKRIANHIYSVNNPNHSNKTSLSNFINKLRKDNIRYNLSWKILSSVQPYKVGQKFCRLCIEELYRIVTSPFQLLNSKIERSFSCLHHSRYLFSKFKT